MPAESSLTIASAGACGFCGKSKRETKALVSSPIIDVMICDECLALCCKLLAEELELDDLDLDGVEHASVASFPESQLAAVFAAAANMKPCVPREGEPTFHCSFCGQARNAVPKLISGPRVFICSGCVDSATALVRQTLQLTR